MSHIIRLLKVVPAETTLFLIDHPNRAKGLRRDAVRICFETLKFHSVFIASQPGLLQFKTSVCTDNTRYHSYCR